MRYHAAAAAALLGAAAPCLLWAQGLQGRVVLPDSTPAAGAVVAVLGSNGATLARAIARADGTFGLRVGTPGRVSIVVQRSGHALAMGAAAELPAAGVVTVRLVADGPPLQLAAAPGGKQRCILGENVDGPLRTLWTAVRADLLATTLAESGRLVLKDAQRVERTLDVDGKHVRDERRTPLGRIDAHPFFALSPDSLARVGYVTGDSLDRNYQAPDARVFLADLFTQTHCFTQAPRDRMADGRAQAGLDFAPVGRSRGLTDIEGTFWVDRETGGLAELEYRFVPAPAARGTFGGSQRFRRLDSGELYVDRWLLRLPVFAVRTMTGDNAAVSGPDRQVRLQSVGRLVLDSMLEQGGEVTAAREATER